MPQINLAALQQQAAAQQDFTKTTEGGSFEREVPDAGRGFCRLREYIELGIHPHGKVHTKDKPMCRMVFELCHQKHIIEYEKDGEKLKRAHTMSVEVPISDNVSSDYIKIFNLLNWHGKFKHPIEAIDQPMMCDIVHNDYEKDGKNTTYANLWKGVPKDKQWTLIPPVIEADPLDPASTARDISANIPPLLGGAESIKVFLWLYADMPQWDSLFIDGTRTVKKGDKEVEESKNWIQNKIKSAKNYAGSPIEQLLASGGVEMDLPTSQEQVNQSAGAADTDAALKDLGL